MVTSVTQCMQHTRVNMVTSRHTLNLSTMATPNNHVTPVKENLLPYFISFCCQTRGKCKVIYNLNQIWPDPQHCFSSCLWRGDLQDLWGPMICLVGFHIYVAANIILVTFNSTAYYFARMCTTVARTQTIIQDHLGPSRINMDQHGSIGIIVDLHGSSRTCQDQHRPAGISWDLVGLARTSMDQYGPTGISQD